MYRGLNILFYYSLLFNNNNLFLIITTVFNKLINKLHSVIYCFLFFLSLFIINIYLLIIFSLKKGHILILCCYF